MAVSYDGYEFTAVNDGQPVILGYTIVEQRSIRDPHIFRGPDGAFYLAMTDLHIFGQRDGKKEVCMPNLFRIATLNILRPATDVTIKNGTH